MSRTSKKKKIIFVESCRGTLQITYRELGNASNQRNPISTDPELNQTLILTAALFDRDWIGLCGECCQKVSLDL